MVYDLKSWVYDLNSRVYDLSLGFKICFKLDLKSRAYVD